MAKRIRCLLDRTNVAGRTRPASRRCRWRQTTTWFGHWFVVGALVVLAAGCQKKSACVKNGVIVEIAGNHGHEASIPTEHIRRGVGGMYPVRGGAHEHTMMLTDADMKALLDGKPVTTRSTSVDSHVHEISVACKE